AQLKLRLAGAERGRELVLHAHKPAAEDLVGLLDLLRVRVRDAGHPDLARVQQVTDRADRIGVRDARIRAVELVEPDRLDAQALERGVTGLLEVFRRAVDRPAAVTGAQVAALGRDQHVRGVPAIAGHGAGDQGLVVPDLVRVQVVGVRGVDQGYSGVQ